MDCQQVRVELSARLDGEHSRVPGAELDGHVAGCLGCRRWLTQAERINRTVRVQAVNVPDLTARVLAAVDADARATGARGRAVTARATAAARRQILRVALALTAVAQLAVALPELLIGLGVPLEPHLSREMASFDVALAVGFGLAAYRPERARAFVPVAVVLAGCLAVTSAVDIANATTAAVHELGHVATAVQAGLLWALGRSAGPDRPLTPSAAAVRG